MTNGNPRIRPQGESSWMTFSEARDYLLTKAKELSVELEVLASEKRELSLEADHGSLSEMTQATQGGIGLRLVTNGKVGYAYSEERTPEALDWALTEARENAELQNKGDGFLPAGKALGQTDLLSEGLSAPLEEKVQAALELEGGLRKDERLAQVQIARYLEEEQSVWLASTQGASGGYRDGVSGLVSFFVMQQGESLKQGLDTHFSKEFHGLEPGRTALDMTHKLGRLLGAKPLKTGRYTAYFESKVFAQLLAVFCSMFSGKSVMEGQSRLADKLGERVASDLVTLIDDPALESGLANRPFDSEGTPSKAVTLLDKGVLGSFLHNSQTAKALGQDNTGHASRSYSSPLGVGPSNLYLKPGTGLTPQRGIIVSEVSGLHAGANPITGDFSLQGLGLLVEDGEVVHPVENFAFASNFLDVLQRITGLGETLEWEFTGVAVGAPLVEVADVSFAGA